MAGIKSKAKKEPEIIESFKTVPITNLRDVMKKMSDNTYQARYPIFDRIGDKFLLEKNKPIISEERLRKMELENWRSMKVHKEPRYYFTKDTVDVNFN